MKWTVMLRSRALVRPLATLAANVPEHKLETEGSRREPIGIKLQLQKLGSLRRRDGCRRLQRRGHPRRSGCGEPGVPGQNEQKCQAHTSGQCTRETDPVTHQDERSRISTSEISAGPLRSTLKFSTALWH